MRNFATTIADIRCFLVYRMRGLLIQLHIAIGVEVTTSDNVSSTYTMVLLVMALALNVQNNTK